MKNKKRIRCGFCYRLRDRLNIQRAKNQDWKWECKDIAGCISYRAMFKRKNV